MKEPVIRVAAGERNITISAVDGVFSLGSADADKFIQEEGWWYLARLKIKDDHQGHSLGSLLLYKLCEIVKQRGDKGIIVYPGGYGSSPRRLKKFYTRMGFKQTEKGVMRWQPNLGNTTGSSSQPAGTKTTPTSGTGASTAEL